jgi:hypothetical protein
MIPSPRKFCPGGDEPRQRPPHGFRTISVKLVTDTVDLNWPSLRGSVELDKIERQKTRQGVLDC